MEYTTPHTPQMNGVIEIIFYVIKEGELAMLLNKKLNNTYQKMLWAKAVHTRERVRNGMATTANTTSQFENVYGEKSRSLVCSWSSEVSDTSPNGTSSRKKLRIKPLRRS